MYFKERGSTHWSEKVADTTAVMVFSSEVVSLIPAQLISVEWTGVK
jgi:hypothetical protein